MSHQEEKEIAVAELIELLKKFPDKNAFVLVHTGHGALVPFREVCDLGINSHNKRHYVKIC